MPRTPGRVREDTWGRLFNPARPTRSPWSTLRSSHFPDPPNLSLEHRSSQPLDTEGCHDRTPTTDSALPTVTRWSWRDSEARSALGLQHQNGAGPRPTSDINTCVASTFRTPVTATAPIWS